VATIILYQKQKSLSRLKRVKWTPLETMVLPHELAQLRDYMQYVKLGYGAGEYRVRMPTPSGNKVELREIARFKCYSDRNVCVTQRWRLLATADD